MDMQSARLRQTRRERCFGKRRGVPQTSIPGLNLVHPRYQGPQLTSFDLRQVVGGAKLKNEVAERLMV